MHRVSAGGEQRNDEDDPFGHIKGPQCNNKPESDRQKFQQCLSELSFDEIEDDESLTRSITVEPICDMVTGKKWPKMMFLIDTLRKHAKLT